MRHALPVLLLASCFPAQTDLVGKECDAQHECGRGLFCVAGRCATEPAPALPPSTMPMPMPIPDGGPSPVTDAGSVPAACDAGAAETDCSNGRDDDCDGLIDCADPSCSTRACDGANPAAVCCGTSCKDLSSDPQNCGMCGGICGAGQTCRGIAVGGFVTGRCTCNGSASACPATRDDQSCVANHCSCNDDKECAPSQRCQRLSGGPAAPGVCHY